MNLLILLIGLIVLSFVIYTVIRGMVKLAVVGLIILIFFAVFNQIIESNIIDDANDSIDRIKASEEYNKTKEYVTDKTKEGIDKSWKYVKKKIVEKLEEGEE